MIAVALVSETVINRAVFMPAAKEMTGENHVSVADKRPGLSNLVDDMTILEHFADTGMNMASAITYIGFLVGGFDEDIDEFIAYTRGMPHLHTTRIIQRGVRCCIITGSIDQWRTATVHGCNAHALSPVRTAFNEIYKILTQKGLGRIFDDYKPVNSTNGTFLLERK